MSAHASKGIRFVPKPPLLGHAHRCMALALGADARASQITGRLFQVLTFKCLSVDQLPILPFNYLYSAVLATL
jgi:hypothetical protein